MSSIILSIIIGYFFGSIPFGYIAGKLAGRDIRKEGYKKLGVSNVYSVLGLGPAVVVFLGDFLKGIAPIVILSFFGVPESVASIGGLSAIVAHNWPLFLGFRGGRGVVTSCGVLCYLLPLETICGIVVFIILSIILKGTSLPTFISICIIIPVLVLLLREPLWSFSVSLAISFLLIFTRVIGRLSQVVSMKDKKSAILNLVLYDGLKIERKSV